MPLSLARKGSFLFCLFGAYFLFVGGFWVFGRKTASWLASIYGNNFDGELTPILVLISFLESAVTILVSKSI